MNHTIHYVTTNPGKFDEVAQYIAEHESGITLKQSELELAEFQTRDQKKIALDKARQAWNALKKPLLVDDSGIYFSSYNQFPGTLTKFVYQGIGYYGILKLALGDEAYFLLHLVYYYGDDQYEIFQGRCDGTIVQPRGTFFPTLPWDCIFQPHGSNKTYAELRHEPEAPQFLYRLKAVQAFVNWISKHSAATYE